MRRRTDSISDGERHAIGFMECGRGRLTLIEHREGQALRLGSGNGILQGEQRAFCLKIVLPWSNRGAVVLEREDRAVGFMRRTAYGAAVDHGEDWAFGFASGRWGRRTVEHSKGRTLGFKVLCSRWPSAVQDCKGGTLCLA